MKCCVPSNGGLLAALAMFLGALVGCGSSSNDPVVDPDVHLPLTDAASDAATEATVVTGDASAGTARTIPWSYNLMDVGGTVGTIHTLRCGPGDVHLVFGTTIYAGHSSICMAAYHSELITMSEGGTFRLRVEPVQRSFMGSRRNGVTSGDWPDPAPGFSFPDARPPMAK